MFFLCAFLVPIIWFINPFQLYHLYERHHHYGRNTVSQHEANHLMADYHYDMGKRYAEIIEMMWFTFLYADLIPLGAFLILIGFCIYYWVDKFNLLRRASLEGNISGDLAMKALFLLDLTLFWRFLGELIFDEQIRDGATTTTIIFLCLSIVYMIIPWETFLELVNSERFKLNEKTFTYEKKRFQHDNYRTYHPIYSHLSDKESLGEKELMANDLFHFTNALPDKNSSVKPQYTQIPPPRETVLQPSPQKSQPQIYQSSSPAPSVKKSNVNFRYQ